MARFARSGRQHR